MKMTYLIPVSFCLFFSITIGACSQTEKGEYSFEVSERNGVVTAVTKNGPKYAEELFEYQQILTLREDPNNPESLIDRPRWFVMSEDGTFFLPHYHDNRIQVFSPEGDYLRSFGRTGDGPGEFRLPFFLSLIDGTITLFDFQQQRATVFRADGTLQEVVRHPDPEGTFEGLHVGPDGILVGLKKPRKFDGNVVQMRASVLVSSAGGDSLHGSSTEWVDWGTRRSVSGPVMVLQPYAYAPDPLALYDSTSKSYLLSSGNDPVIRWYDLDGTLSRVFDLSLPKEQIDRKQVIEEVVTVLEGIQTPEISPDQARSRLRSYEFPRHKAFWRSVIHDSGYLWLEKPILYSVLIDQYFLPIYRVISPEGEYLGDTEWPAQRATVMYGRLLALVSDQETGSIIPTVYEIIPSVEGLKYH